MEASRLEKERFFHDERFSTNDSIRERASKFYRINKFAWNRYFEIISAHCEGKKLLEYGCGTGSGSKQWLKFGAILTGIDISAEGIKKAKEKIARAGYQADYFVMNAEKTEFPDETFDIVVGMGIIHHLDLSNSFEELRRILKRDGHAVFMEPLGHNPLINLYRKLTPKMRTEDEHPLKLKDIKLLNQYFYHVKIHYFELFTLLAVPFRNLFFFEVLIGFLRQLDKLLFRVPVARRYAWMTVIHASHPREVGPAEKTVGERLFLHEKGEK